MTLKISADGQNAIKTYPATEQIISKEEMKNMYERFVRDISHLENELAELKAKEKECKNICTQLGIE